MLHSIIYAVIKSHPEIIPHLTGRARWVASAQKSEAYKSQDFFLTAIERMVRNVYYGFMGGDFIDVMANLISGQIMDAYQQAWLDDGGSLPIPEYLTSAAEADILRQYDFVDQYYRDIVDARVDKTAVEPLIARAQLWANQWNNSYNNASLLIQKEEGGNLIWKLGATEKHCDTCSSLNGIVASAKEWEESGYKPQNPPNSYLTCGGWRCDCSLEPTEQRRSRNVRARLGL